MLERLNEDIKAALLKGDGDLVNTLRFIKNSLDVAEKQKGSSLSGEEEILILRKELKKRQEAAELYEKGGNTVSSEKEKHEITLIKKYLPEDLSEDQVKNVLLEVIERDSLDRSMSSMGQLMLAAKQKLGDKADPSVLAKLARELLSGEQ